MAYTLSDLPPIPNEDERPPHICEEIWRALSFSREWRRRRQARLLATYPPMTPVEKADPPIAQEKPDEALQELYATAWALQRTRQAEREEQAILKQEQREQTRERRRVAAQQHRLETLANGQWQSILERWDNRCAYCGIHQDDLDTVLHHDHVIPLCQGGGSEPENLVPACKPCNCRKGGRTPEQAGMPLRECT